MTIAGLGREGCLDVGGVERVGGCGRRTELARTTPLELLRRRSSSKDEMDGAEELRGGPCGKGASGIIAGDLYTPSPCLSPRLRPPPPSWLSDAARRGGGLSSASR